MWFLFLTRPWMILQPSFSSFRQVSVLFGNFQFWLSSWPGMRWTPLLNREAEGCDKFRRSSEPRLLAVDGVWTWSQKSLRAKEQRVLDVYQYDCLPGGQGRLHQRCEHSLAACFYLLWVWMRKWSFPTSSPSSSDVAEETGFERIRLQTLPAVTMATIVYSHV